MFLSTSLALATSLLSLVTPLSPPAGPPSIAIRSSLQTVVTTATDGSLCAIDPATGRIEDRLAASAVDVVASRTSPRSLSVLAPADGGAGEIATFSFSRGGLLKTSSTPFTAEDGRLLDVSHATAGYAFDEGSTLFSIEGAASTGAVLGLPLSAIALPIDDVSADFLALEDDGVAWHLRKAHTEGSTAEDLGISLSVPHVSGASAALVDDRGVPEIVTLSGHTFSVLAADGTLLFKNPISPLHDQIVDAISLGHRGVVVLTRPSAKLFLLTPARADEIVLKAGGVTDEPWFSHRIAFDEARDRIWVATGTTLFRVQLGSLIATKNEGCSATSVALVYGYPEPLVT